MKKYLVTALIASALALTTAMPSFAGQWQENAQGWWYQNDDGGYPANGWQWINGRSYYFDSQGYCLMDTVTPDGYTVDASGAWTVNGVVQIQEQQPAATDTEDTLTGTYVAYNQITCRSTTIVIPKDGLLRYTETGDGYHFDYYFDYGLEGNEIYIYDPGLTIYYDMLTIEPDGNLSYTDYAEEGAFTVWFVKQ